MNVNRQSCPVCGAPIEIQPGDSAMVCDYCESDLRITADGKAVPFFHTSPDPEPARFQDQEIDLTEIRKELAAGRKINAVKLVREQTNLTLNESLEYVEAMIAGEAIPAAPVQPAGPTFPSGPDAGLDEVKALIDSGKKIEAIKRYRELNDTSLAEAKAAVEAIERGEQIPVFISPKAPPFQKMTGKMSIPPNASGGGCGRIILGTVLFFMLVIGGCGQFVRTTDMHACVIETIASDPELEENLGSPITLSPLLWVVGYSSESDFGGNTNRSAGYFVSATGQRDKAMLYIEAFENSSGYYGVQANPVPNRHDIFIQQNGEISACGGNK